MQHVCSQAHTPFQWFGVNPQAEKRLQVLQKQRSHGIDFRQKVTTGQSFRLCYRRRRLSHLLELTRHYGDSLGSYRAFKQLRGNLLT